MKKVKLSICIPTYNFGEFIGEALESIIKQAGDEVEIVVGDGASTDNTEAVIRHYQADFPGLMYHNLGEKGGVDLDIAKTVGFAQGDYCWLMSADDVLKPGAIARVLAELQFGHSVYLCNRTECDRNLKPFNCGKSWLADEVDDKVFHFSGKSEFIDFFNASESIGALFSYISSVIVDRNKWNEIGYDERFAGTNFAHVPRLFFILKDGKNNGLKYIKDSLVFCRGANDSFLNNGYVNRILIDFDGYRRIGEEVFPDSDIRRAFNAVIKREHKFYFLTRLKSEARDECEWDDILARLHYYRYGRGELFLINLLGSSKRLVGFLRYIKKLLRSY